MVTQLVRGAAAAVLAGLAAIAAPTPAAAIETTAFGIEVVEHDPEGRLRIPIEAGEVATGRLRVWNKLEGPLALHLSVVPATVAADGSASLGGDAEPVDWVAVPERVELAAGAAQEITVTVNAPRQLTSGSKTVAVLAEPEVKGEAPAVLKRLAITTYLVAEKGSLRAGLGWLPWIALGLFAVVLGVLVRRIPAMARRT